LENKEWTKVKTKGGPFCAPTSSSDEGQHKSPALRN
jgi:hypothetical protein